LASTSPRQNGFASAAPITHWVRAAPVCPLHPAAQAAVGAYAHRPATQRSAVQVPAPQSSSFTCPKPEHGSGPTSSEVPVVTKTSSVTDPAGVPLGKQSRDTA